MNFEWDQAKSNACFSERGFDFVYVIRAFIDPNRFIKKDTRWDYGEERYQLFAEIDQRIFVVVYTVRHSSIRIISARKANKREVVFYEKNKN